MFSLSKNEEINTDICVFVGCVVLYKPWASCCFGEMSLPASVPSS